MNKLEQKTGKLIRDFVIKALDHAGEADEFQDQITEACDEAGQIEVPAPDPLIDTLLDDPKVKAAFRKYVSGVVGAFQVMEEEFGAGAQDD